MAADRSSRDRRGDRGDGRSRHRHQAVPGRDRATASTSSWSTSRPTRWPGPLLARQAREAGVVYSLAWGDQPALICEHVDWARTCGFKVVAAGKGTRYHPTYHRSNPDTVWEILDQYLKIKDRSHINPKMFNSFIDGTKSGIEMTAVCNATGLVPQANGLALSAGLALRAGRCVQAQERGRHAGEEGRHRGRLLDRPRRQGRAPSSRHGHLRRDRERQRLRRPVLRRVQLPARQERHLRGAVPADAHDRAGARHLRGLGGAAGRSRPARPCASTRTWSPPPSAR